MALCNQPEACTSDLGDDQSRYFLYNAQLYWEVIWRKHVLDWLLRDHRFHSTGCSATTYSLGQFLHMCHQAVSIGTVVNTGKIINEMWSTVHNTGCKLTARSRSQNRQAPNPHNTDLCKAIQCRSLLVKHCVKQSFFLTTRYSTNHKSRTRELINIYTTIISKHCQCVSVCVCVCRFPCFLIVCIYVCLWVMCLIHINTIQYNTRITGVPWAVRLSWLENHLFTSALFGGWFWPVN